MNWSSKPDIPEVEPTEAHNDVNANKAAIVDVRETEELEQASVSGALHIPLGELQSRLDDVPRDRNVYVLCHSGQRSAMATEFLREIGHNRVWNVRGGIVAWYQAGLPVLFAEC